MKIWCTKYLFTDGIEELDADPTHISDMVSVSRSGTTYKQLLHGEGKEWHKTEESAKKRANEMRDRKLKSLKKQIDKIEKMQF